MIRHIGISAALPKDRTRELSRALSLGVPNHIHGERRPAVKRFSHKSKFRCRCSGRDRLASASAVTSPSSITLRRATLESLRERTGRLTAPFRRCRSSAENGGSLPVTAAITGAAARCRSDARSEPRSSGFPSGQRCDRLGRIGCDRRPLSRSQAGAAPTCRRNL